MKIKYLSEIGLASVAVLAVIILGYLVGFRSPATPIYDEKWYLDTIPLLWEYGYSSKFLEALPGPAGPTFTFVQAWLTPISNLAFPAVRFVNVVLLIACAILVGAIWRTYAVTEQLQKSWHITACFLGLPFVGVSAGMALTELPAMFFLCIALYLSSRAVVFAHNSSFSIALSIAAAPAITLAILGRQPYLVAVPLLLFAAQNRVQFRSIGITVGLGLLLVVPVFLVWRGLVPPLTPVVSAGWSLQHAGMAFGTAFILMALLAPEFFRPLLSSRKTVISLLIASALVIVVVPHKGIIPARTLTLKLIGEAYIELAATVVWLIYIFLAVCFLAASAWRWVEHRRDPLIAFCIPAAIACLITTVKVTHIFSTRYVFVALPFLVLAAARYIRVDSFWLTSRLAVGVAISLATLSTYYAQNSS